MAKKISSMFCLGAVSVSLLAGCGKEAQVQQSEADQTVLSTSCDGLRITSRQAAHAIHPLILHRWSSRAFSGEPISDQELMQIFEAARWAPSAYNNQPWRFIYAKRGTPQWDTLFNLLVDFNKQWTHNAGALAVIVSQEKTESGRDMHTHSFDTGAAWQNIALQSTAMGFVVHGMSGFDYEKAKQLLNIPDGYTVEAMFAVGRPGKVEDLPEQLQAKETPSGRKPVEEIAFEGSFPQ